MGKRVISCDRCDSKIVDHPHRRVERWGFARYVGDDGKEETEEAALCSMCLDDLWEFIFETDVDRSDKADPVPLQRVANSVDRHISELEELKIEIESHD